MCSFQSLKFTHFQAIKKGIIAFGRYAEWYHEYSFLLEPDGRVMGKTSLGAWEELTVEAAALIRNKIRLCLAQAN